MGCMVEERVGGRMVGGKRESSPGHTPAEMVKCWIEDSGSWNPDQCTARWVLCGKVRAAP